MAYSKKTYFFCGIGGSGMSAIAQVLVSRGARVLGSDRNYDQKKNTLLFDALKSVGINMVTQDGSAMTGEIDFLVVSAAIEDSIPDVKAAKSCGVTIIRRAELLAEIFNGSRGIAVGGTSGKSTVTGMLGHILTQCNTDPTIINGAVLISASDDKVAGLGNARCGKSDICVIESDESDGSIALYRPAVAVVNNITLDHKPIEELRPLFRDFIRCAGQAVINVDCPEAAVLVDENDKVLTFSINGVQADWQASQIEATLTGVKFLLKGEILTLRVPGRHNVSNALAAMAAATSVGIFLQDAMRTIQSFRGVRRRLETLGTANDITVIDDFAHNPDKIEASLATLKAHAGRLLIMYQPHGFGPTRFLRDGLVAAFGEGLGEDDIVLWPEIFYAGGTATRDISSQNLVDDITAQGRQATFFQTRDEIGDWLLANAKAGDRIVVMGARDDTLTTFAKELLVAVGAQPFPAQTQQSISNQIPKSEFL